MTMQVRFLRECFVAQTALERSVTRVCSQMSAQIGALIKRLGTKRTLEGLFSRVNFEVPVEI